MKVLVLYRPNSEFARGVEEFVHDLQKQHNIGEKHLEIIDYDSREGAAIASLYDLMGQPAIMVVADDGSFVKHWQGPSMPLAEEVAGYIYTSRA